ncbi:hypothetical protein WJX73_006975 [Symbiochloris irregularis]|uniref:Peroxisome biogenesis protein 22 n=1 Tax=Symbiochloris irregularis TaxID=706552 RepID=A0AAW1NMJ7_9CHLO
MLLFAEAPPGLTLTGVLGLAAVLYGFYHLKAGPGNSGQARQRDRRQQAQASRPPGAQHQSESLQAGFPQGQLPQGTSAAKQAVGSPLQAQLAGIRKVTISAPGVLLKELLPHELQDGASLRPAAARVLAEMLHSTAVYIMAHVSDDIGEATVRGALEAGGLVGKGPGQILPHRILFCSTLAGKEALVRQLEPELHIDAHEHTVKSLQRFMPQLLLISARQTASASVAYKNVAYAASLEAAFHTGQ